MIINWIVRQYYKIKVCNLEEQHFWNFKDNFWVILNAKWNSSFWDWKDWLIQADYRIGE